MAKHLVPRTPTRRSKRGQPIVTPSHTHQSDDSECIWSSAPLHTRTATADDLYEEEWDEDADMETTFYGEFKIVKRSIARGKGKKKAQSDETTTFSVGDTVLIKSVARQASIAVIIAMWETVSKDAEEGDGKMRVKVHWFLRPAELASHRAKRDHIENEIYYSLRHTAVLSPSDVLSQCAVSSRISATAEAKSTLAWSVSPTKPKRGRSTGDSDNEDDGSEREENGDERFYCHLAVDSQRRLFYEFDWGAHRFEALEENHMGKEKEWGSGEEWDVAVAEPKKAKGKGKPSPRKKRKITEDDGDEGDETESESEADSGDEFGASEEDEEDEDEDEDELLSLIQDSPSEAEDDEDDVPKTPSKKRKRATTTSPSKRKSKAHVQTPRRTRTRTLAAPTPHSKAIIRSRKSKSAVRPAPPQFTSTLRNENLPRDPWLRAMHVLHVGARPDALPCREDEYARVMRSVEELLEEGSGGCVYISGVPGTGKTATVHAIVRELKRMAEHSETNPFTYVEINGLKIPEPSAAYTLLWEAVSGHDATREGHLKISSKEALKQLTRHFSGGARARAGPGGHACVVLMDELDQLVTAKQDVVYNFFNWPTLVGSKLVVLAVANTMDLPERVMTGRVRSRLGMIRINFQPYTTPQLEKIVHARLLSAREGLSKDEAAKKDVIAPDGIKFAAMKVSSISGDARRVLDICRRTVELVQPFKRTARTEDVKEVIKVMQNSPTAAYLRDCSFHERLMLAALVKCVKREGVEEIRWGEVQHQHLTYISVLTGPDDPTRQPSSAELGIVLDSLVASRAMLYEDGLAASRKMEGDRRVVLNLEQTEVERVLGDVGGQRWKNVMST